MRIRGVCLLLLFATAAQAKDRVIGPLVLVERTFEIREDRCVWKRMTSGATGLSCEVIETPLLPGEAWIRTPEAPRGIVLIKQTTTFDGQPMEVRLYVDSNRWLVLAHRLGGFSQPELRVAEARTALEELLVEKLPSRKASFMVQTVLEQR